MLGIVCTVSGACMGQSFHVNLSPRHASKINELKSGASKLKFYRKYFSKDSARQVRKNEKKVKKEWDSLMRASRKNERLLSAMQRKGIRMPTDTLAVLNQYASLLPRDSTETKALISKGLTSASRQAGFDPLLLEYKSILKDSAARDSIKAKAVQEAKGSIERKLQSQYGVSPKELRALMSGDSVERKKIRAKAVLEARQQSMKQLPPGQRKQLEAYQQQYGQYSKEVKQYLFFLKDSVDHTDTLTLLAAKRAENMASTLARQQMGGRGFTEMDKYNKQLQELQDVQKGLQNPSSMKDKAAEQAMEQFAGQTQKVKTLQSQITKLKSKYSSVLRSDDLSTATKAKSLEGRPLRERWVIGGNFNISNTAPLMLDLAPQFGYRIDKRFQVGVSGIYRATFVDSVNLVNSLSPERYGYSVFSSYGLIMNFFGYAEWEHTRSIVRTDAVNTSRQWVPSLLVGVGRKFRIHPKVGGTILILWDAMHVNGKSPYHDALVIKTGFQLSELGLMKKK
ncbi:MAG: hypothetical protein K2U26_08300 [Cyclobacteriaceae bacterium]|nr:hypothetical protein [Cyclobacteriaceae bacterium]